MPYIDEQTRKLVLTSLHPQTAGELNFLITTIVDRFIAENDGISYTNINTAIGVLECAKLELYRRVAAPYEGRKCVENGDVYSCNNP